VPLLSQRVEDKSEGAQHGKEEEYKGKKNRQIRGNHYRKKNS